MFESLHHLARQPNWFVVALIGSVIGVILKPFLQLIVFLLKLIKKRDIESTWYGYYYIYKNGSNCIGKETLRIRRGVFDKYVIKGVSVTSKGQKYSGKVILERNFLVIKMKPTIHDEEIFIRLKRTIPGNDEIMHGLWSAIDFDGNAAVGPMVISRHEIDENQLKDIIENNVIIVDSLKNMVIR